MPRLTDKDAENQGMGAPATTPLCSLPTRPCPPPTVHRMPLPATAEWNRKQELLPTQTPIHKSYEGNSPVIEEINRR